MALVSDEVLSSRNDEVESSSSSANVPIENDDIDHIDMSLTKTTDEEEKQASTSTPIEPPLSTSSSISSDEIDKENTKTKRQNRLKHRSVSFAPTVEEFLIPARSSYSSTPASIDFIDALVESYKLQTSTYLFPVEEERKYIPKTTRTRLNPNWREHRTRHLMNKLEELSLWDREEELKATQAQFLREQKLEQIQDRQRNHDLCLNLMRQRHESEIESALLLDRIASSINDDNVKGTIARTMSLIPPGNSLAYDLPVIQDKLKRHVRHELSGLKTPAGRYRQFETNMNTKMEKINEKLQPDREIMRAYSPYRTTIPPTYVPLFSETYSTLLTTPDPYSSTRYHYGVATHLHQPQHASSPDYETRHRSSSKRDVRVPLKEQSNNNYDDDNDDYNNSRMSSNSRRRPTNIISSTATSLYDCSTLANTPRDYSYLHSRQPISNNIHHRSLNDDLNAITNFSLETSKTILHSIAELPVKSTNKRVKFIDQDNNEENFNSSKMTHQPEIISRSSTR